ncbi:MAG TPA: tyrosine-type recombinase/integrase [Tepidisphaeraceae bacterium]|nr:tyrosine-type recombinase/integrase [Tepidisphaeraceae bacterium]
MKLHERELVTGTEPKVYIGRRCYRDKDGVERVSWKYAAEYCVGGRRFCESLKTGDRDLAVRRAHEIVGRIVRGERGQVARRDSIAQVARAYLEMQGAKGRAPTTLTKYTHVLSEFTAWCMAHFPRPAAQFTEQDFWRWHQSMMDDGYALKTRADRSVIVKQLFKWAARVRLIPTNTLAECSVPDPPPTPQPCFSPHQTATVLNAADPHERVMFMAMAYEGLRFGEVRDLMWPAVSMPPDEPGFITVALGGSNGTTKGRRSRRIPLHPALREELEKLPRIGERVFYARASKKYPNGDHPVGERRLLLSLKRLCRRLGFPNPDQYKLHTFRHTFASMLARNQVSYKYALSFMGHRSSEILDLYYTQFDDTAVQAIKTINYPTAPPVAVAAMTGAHTAEASQR